MKFNTILTKKVEELEQATRQGEIDTKLLSTFHNVPFYHEWTEYMKPCTLQNPRCFNCLVGLPKNKYGETNPLFDYQRQLYDTLLDKRMIYVLKATGLGITEFMIRFIAWPCLKDNALANTDIVIITGSRLELSISIIERLKKLFIDYISSFEFKSTTVVLNNVTIKAYPSNHLDDARGIPHPSIIYADESDFFQPQEQENLRDVIERYMIKSDPWIILVSTPNKPDSIMDRIRQEEISLYERLYFSYKVGINRMWTEEAVEQQKLSPSFEREYNLSFAHNIDNIYNYNDIEQASEDPYSLAEAEITNPAYTKPVSISSLTFTSSQVLVHIKIEASGSKVLS